MLIEAVESVLQQTYRPIEIIIVNDGSTDNTMDVARKLADEHEEITAMSQCNSGPGAARETGRQAARGEYIQYLDSDDILLPEKFSLQVKALLKNRGCDVAYGKTEHMSYGSERRYQAWKRTGEKIDTMFPSFLVSRWWGTSTPLYRRDVTDQAGAWMSLCNEEDWEYDCRIASYDTELAYIDEFVSVQRGHNDHLSAHGDKDPIKLFDRAIAREKIYKYAVKMGIAHDSDEMQHFSKYAFLLSRQCALAGLDQPAQNLLELSVKANGGINIKHRVFRCLSKVLGWKNTAKLVAMFE